MVLFSHTWTQEAGDENYTLYVPEVDVFGVGPTKEAAIASLIETIQEYAKLYFADLRYYQSPPVSRTSHYGPLSEVAACAGDLLKIRGQFPL